MKRFPARLRLIKGGKRDFRVGGVAIVLAPSGKPPFAVDAVAIEEDTWQVLGSELEIREITDTPLSLFVELHEAKPLRPGTVVVGSGAPLRCYAIVYDVGSVPCTRPEWVRAAISELFRLTAERGSHALSLPPLGVRHGRLPIEDAIDLLLEGLRGVRNTSLRRLWLVVPEELLPAARLHLMVRLDQEEPAG